MMFFKTQTKKAKIGLALGGGSTLGFAHIGVLKALEENNIPIDYISGTSAGALVASCFAYGMTLEKIIDASEGLNWKKLSKFGRSTLGLNSNEPMNRFITDILGNVKIEDSKIPLSIIATDIENKEMVVLRKGDLHEAIRASTALPGMFIPVEIDGKMLVDGALTENVPVTALKEMGADIRIGVNLSAHKVKLRPQNIFEVLATSFVVLSSHRDRGLTTNSDIVIEPNLTKFDFSKFKDTNMIIEEGYRATLEKIDQIKLKIKVFEEGEEKKGVLEKIKRYFTFPKL